MSLIIPPPPLFPFYNLFLIWISPSTEFQSHLLRHTKPHFVLNFIPADDVLCKFMQSCDTVISHRAAFSLGSTLSAVLLNLHDLYAKKKKKKKKTAGTFAVELFRRSSTCSRDLRLHVEDF